MPGILPMKVIKIGSNAQSRIAQACDRCRSKKIRCDGIRPCCTQCANVGFECKTSDKLSRRAFPRGYTESLEERVRSLEAEVRELKDLLDEKDEKIDMLSRIHSHSSQPIHLPSPRRPSESSLDSIREDFDDYDEPDEVFKVRQSPCLTGEGSDSYFAGTSSARNLVESFKSKAKDSGHTVKDINTDELLGKTTRNEHTSTSTPVVWIAPPRLLSDQLVNIFFQEWAPLFPVLHRPTFLRTYERFVASSETLTDKAELAHLNLVFSIAALASGTGREELDSLESQWRAAIDAIMNDNTVETLQALVLAQMYCLQKGDTIRLLTYKGLSTTLSARLGLHHIQKPFALGTLTCETRKKLFWTLYTVDCFGAVVLGLPMHIKDDEVSCEYPVDADDEYVTEDGFQPTLPGASTKLSSALALFKASRILSRVLREVYPAKASYELSLKKLSEFSDELDLWEAALPAHLRLHFAQDKPSTRTITSRSPILSFTYHYIRALIQRPAICSKTLGSKASSSLLIHAGSCKRIVQIFQLLDERGMSFSFCLSKNEVLMLSGLGLLFQRIQLDTGSKTLKDNQKTILAILAILSQSDSALRRVMLSFIPDLEASTQDTTKTGKRSSKPSISRTNSDRVTLSEQSHNLQTLTKKQSRTTGDKQQDLSSPEGSQLRQPSTTSPVLSTGVSTSPPSLRLSHSPPSSITGLTQHTKHLPVQPPDRHHLNVSLTNLDYLSFGTEPAQEAKGIEASNPVKTEPQPTQTDWERLLGNLDNGTTNIFDACYGGPPIEGLDESLGLNHKSFTAATVNHALAWNAGLLSLEESKTAGSNLVHPAATSSWSSSEDGVGSTEEFFTTDWASSSSHDEALGTFTLAHSGVDGTFDLGVDWQESLAASV